MFGDPERRGPARVVRCEVLPQDLSSRASDAPRVFAPSGPKLRKVRPSSVPFGPSLLGLGPTLVEICPNSGVPTAPGCATARCHAGNPTIICPLDGCVVGCPVLRRAAAAWARPLHDTAPAAEPLGILPKTTPHFAVAPVLPAPKAPLPQASSVCSCRPGVDFGPTPRSN